MPRLVRRVLPKVKGLAFGQTSKDKESKVISESGNRNLHTLEYKLYNYYASIQRCHEDKIGSESLVEERALLSSDGFGNLSTEKIESQRNLRKANMLATFFLITAGILKPSSAPYAISQLGLSSPYHWARSRYIFSLLQFIQLIFRVASICMNTGQSLAQAINSTKDDPKLCFTIQILVWALLGMIVTQIRYLRTLSYVVNFSVWVNIAICIVTMVGAAMYTPNFLANSIPAGLPVQTAAISTVGVGRKILAIDIMTLAYGGGNIYCEVMAEMANPKQFVYSLFSAELFVRLVYIVFGVFLYSFQGQYSAFVAYQGINPSNLRLASNIMNIIAGMLAAFLYSNVGLKVLYHGFGVADLKFPTLNTKKGILLWGGLAIVYWAIAFVLGAGIPQVSSISALLNAVCVLSFSYTLPTLLTICVLIRDDISEPDHYDPLTGSVIRADTWSEGSRWKRAILGSGWKRLLLKISLLLLFLGELCLYVFGVYGGAKKVNMVPAGLKAFSCDPTNYIVNKF